MRARLRAATALAAAWLSACGPVDAPPDHSSIQPRLIGRRLYSGTFAGRPGILFFEASATALSLAYDTAMCGLMVAWKGPVLGTLTNPDGTYAEQGRMYHGQLATRLWTVRNGEDTVAATVRFLGYDEDSTGFVDFRYALVLPSGDSIKVVESPSLDDHYGDNALRRDFRISGIPYGATVSVLLGGAVGPWPELWEQSGGGLLTGQAGAERLEMTFDDISVTKVRWQGSAAP